MKTAISYVRWSSGRQSLGDSLERQLGKTKEFCAKHGLTLDLELVDAGKSASKGKHIAEGGALATLLNDIKENRIPRGVVIIVESLDRLSRQTVPEALQQFLGILNQGVEIVTLIDGQWYSKKSLGADPMPLLMSLVYMMRAHDESANKAYRLAAVWKRKRDRAIANRTPMTPICPGWINHDKATNRYSLIENRVKKLKLIFWLWNRGWGRQKIARLFNQCAVATWNRKRRKTEGWHHSYINKILTSRAVLGELVPHSTRDQENDDKNSIAGRRKPVAEAIKNFYPPAISEAVFYKAAARRSGARGPIGRKKVANLFQGLLKDGNHPNYTMCYRDHGAGSKWQYVVSDWKRCNPKANLFSWNYHELESLLLQYITDLDWSTLTVSKSQELKNLRDQLSVIEGKLKTINGEMDGLIELARFAKGIAELGAKMQALESDRSGLRRQAGEIRSEIKSKEGFVSQDGQKIIRELADKKGFDSRARLRLAIRQHILRIDLFQRAPDQFKEIGGRCAKLTFVNKVERWVLDRQAGTLRIDGAIPPHAEVVRDKMGGMLQDQRTAKKLPPIKRDEYAKKMLAAPKPRITRAILNAALKSAKAKIRPVPASAPAPKAKAEVGAQISSGRRRTRQTSRRTSQK